MLLSEKQPVHQLALAKEQLLSALHQYKTKPYLPIWGELFTALREFAKQGERLQENVLIYSVHPCGTLSYMYREKQFFIDLPEPGITITLTLEQLIDALLQGSFPPSPS
ncbi:hypothetical protein ACAF76_015615 [Brevibacillus sp. TJ4]|uniref:hypothetical protein n=1 Tax=Brevibacillus sp. TJ4 TaxID=3234853 RepID=UPI0037CDDF4E